MNEPYQRVHSQENSNSTLGTVATHVGFGLATSAALEGGVVAGAKYSKNPVTKSFFNGLAYAKPEYGNKFLDFVNSGISTKQGRIYNYGAAVAGGLLSGALASSASNKQ